LYHSEIFDSNDADVLVTFAAGIRWRVDLAYNERAGKTLDLEESRCQI
jgi:hypothetical protein